MAEDGRHCRTSLKAPSWILRRPLAASSSATSSQTSVMCVFVLRKDSEWRYQLNKALSCWWPSQWRDSHPPPHISKAPCQPSIAHPPYAFPRSPHPPTTLPLPLSLSGAATNCTHKLLSPPPLTPTKSLPFSTLLSLDILFLHQICMPLIKLNYSWLPNIPCPDGCQHGNARLWTCNDTGPTL